MIDIDERDSGDGLRELLWAGPAEKREVAKIWTAALDGRPLLVKGQPRAPSWLSGLSAGFPDDLHQLFTDPVLFESGLLQRTLLLVPEYGSRGDLGPEKALEAMKEFGDFLSRLLRFRRTNPSKAIDIRVDALEALDEIRSDCEADS